MQPQCIDRTAERTSPTRKKRRNARHRLLEDLIFDEHGNRHPRYTARELVAKSAWERIFSVAPMLIRRAALFIKTIPARDRASGFELEDVVLELCQELVRKDADWDPARGAYTTFAGFLTENLCVGLRGRARAIEGGRGGGSKLASIADAKRQNRCTAAMRADETRLAVAAAPIEHIGGVGGIEWDSDTLADLEEEERIEECRRKALRHVEALPVPQMAMVVGLTLGALGEQPMTPRQIALRLGLNTSQVTALRLRAEVLLRDRADATVSRATASTRD